MTPQEIAVLGRYVKALCPAQKFDEYTPDAWLMVLGGLEFADCQEVLPRIAQGRPFIAPSDIAAAVKELRVSRLSAANVIYEPHPEESVTDFLARARGITRAAAGGQIAPSRPTLALPAGGAAFAPPEIGRIVSEVRATRGHPALKAACPWEACLAQPGAWCEKPVGKSSRRALAGFLHPARCTAAGVAYEPIRPSVEDGAA